MTRAIRSTLCGWLLLLVGFNAGAAHRIVSLAPNLTELAYAAGAGEHLVATVEFSNLPDAARRLPRIGDAFRIDLEALLALRPSLVLAWKDGTPPALIEQIRKLQIPVVSFSTQVLDDVPRALRRLGELAGTQSAAELAAARFELEIRSLREQYSARPPVTVFLQVNDRPLYTVNRQQIMNEVLAVCGGRNVFDDLTQLAPTISVEAVLARRPQVIISTDQQPPDVKLQWQKWINVPAVRAGALYDLPAEYLTQASSRMTQGMRQLCDTLDDARQRLGLNQPGQPGEGS